MLKNYLKIYLRNLTKYKAYSIINLLGLTIGLASCILISLYILDELYFDRFHSKADRIYRIVYSETSPDQGERHYGTTSAPVGPAMEAEYPEVVNSARLIALGRHTVQNGNIKFYEQYLMGEQSLFEIFDFEFEYGNREHALEEPNTVVLSQETARKYFGEGTPIGRILSSDRGHELKVTGVLNIPHNSHLQFDAMISFATFATNPRLGPFLGRWEVRGFTTYLLLNEQNDIRSVHSQLAALLNRNLTENRDLARQLALQPLSDIHFLSAHIESDRNAAKGEMTFIYILGVVKDFNFRSLHEKIGPLILGHSHNPIHAIDYFTSKIASVNIPATIKSLEDIHEKYDKVTPFEYHFLDQQLENFYESDQRVSALFGMAAGLAIFIACLGLFGLAAFTAEQRTNEIGVSKVLGATVTQIILLLSKEFTKLVIIALFIAVPIAYFASNRWLQVFAYRIDIGLGTFLIAGLLVLIIAWSTIAYQAIKAALTNPVDALRYE